MTVTEKIIYFTNLVKFWTLVQNSDFEFSTQLIIRDETSLKKSTWPLSIKDDAISRIIAYFKNNMNLDVKDDCEPIP